MYWDTVFHTVTVTGVLQICTVRSTLILTLMCSFPPYFARIWGFWMRFRLVPQIVMGVFPLIRQREEEEKFNTNFSDHLLDVYSELKIALSKIEGKCSQRTSILPLFYCVTLRVQS